MSNLIKRTIFGSLFITLVITSLLFARPYYFQAVFLFFSVFSVREFHHITHSDKWLTCFGVTLAWLLFCALSLTTLTSYYKASLYLMVLYGVVLIAALVAELFKKSEQPIANWGTLLSGQVMVALPFALCNVLFARSAMLLLSLFVIIWMNDTAAYCVGSLLGKHKMFPRVSPGKSWEGAAGGMLFALLIGYLFLADPLHFTALTFPWWQALLISLTVVVFGTLGDLVESLTKRTLGIKDSGNVIPGHGGLLDRFDSTLLAVPAVVLLLWLL